MSSFPEFEDVDIYTTELKSEKPDFHSVFSIQICELAYYGFFDLSKPDWDFAKYSAEQHAQLCDKITKHFWYREICITPPGIWKNEFLRTMNELMPKYKPLYEALDKYPTLFNSDSEYYKARNVYSEFPQTRLNGTNGDYASTGNDTEYERIHQMNTLDLFERLRTYKGVDEMILEEMETLFSPFFSVSMNGF